MMMLGKSLLWVAILGLIVFYIYALISFAILRSSFDPDSELYCATLWQCTITVVRYGLVGDLFDVSIVTIGWLVEQGLTSHSTQFRSFRRRCFYRSDEKTNSVKALKEGG